MPVKDEVKDVARGSPTLAGTVEKMYEYRSLIDESLNASGKILILSPKQTALKVLGNGYPNRLSTVTNKWMEALDLSSRYDLYSMDSVVVKRYGQVKNLIVMRNAMAETWHVKSASVSSMLGADKLLISDGNINSLSVHSGYEGILCDGEIKSEFVDSKGPIFAKKIRITNPKGHITAYNKDTGEQFPIYTEEILPDPSYIRKGRGFFVCTKPMEK